MNLLFWEAVKYINTAKLIQINFKITYPLR